MLKNTRIIVTGANGNLGMKTVSKAAGYGANVVGIDKKKDDNNATNVINIDLTKVDAIENLVSSVGTIDALVNIAGGFVADTGIKKTDLQNWDNMMEMNVTTLRNMVSVVLPIMKAQKKGKIINIGALSAINGKAGMSAYTCSKSIVSRLTESLAEELKDQNINVNAILPAIIDTPENRNEMPNENYKNWVSTDDLAEVICFLCSERAKAINGALIPVAGFS